MGATPSKRAYSAPYMSTPNYDTEGIGMDWYDGADDALNFHGDNSTGPVDVAGILLDHAFTCPAEEESQVVPVSLDHLSRDELCRMIYRLEYERNTLRDQLNEATLRNQQFHDVDQMSSKPSHDGKKRKTRTRAESSRFAHPPQQELAQEPPPPHEIPKLQQNIGQKLVSAIQQSTHGLRQIPKTTITERSLSLSTVTTMMRDHDGQKFSDTPRMIKWLLTDDRQISALLRLDERLIHPVPHDCSGHILPAGSIAANVYHWARWVSLEMRFDKRDRTLLLRAKTKEVGSGRPENAHKLLRYSQGELESLT